MMFSMEFFHGSLLLWIIMGFISFLSLINAKGTIQFHRKQMVMSDNISNKETRLVPQTHVYSPSDVEESKESGSSTSDRRVFNVMSFGAVGDGSTDDTEAFRKAWNAACEVDSSVLLAPHSHVFLISSISFNGPCKPDLTFQVEGVLIPPEGPDNWPKFERIWNWLVFYKVDRMKLRGNGTFDGKGEKWWELPCKPHKGPNGTTLEGPCDSPALIHFFMSSNVVVEGLQMTNSPSFHIKFDNCNEVLVTNLTINSPALSPNTDGIHIENTTSVSIYNSDITNGDDCISIGAGCSDVDIANITCTNSHGISIGSLGAQNTQACVSNITVKNVYLKNSDNGLRIKTWQGGTGSVTGITFENIVMDNVKNCIIVNQYYCLSNDCRNQTEALLVTDVSYKNIKGTYDVLTKPIHFACSDSVPCMGIRLSEVELVPAVGDPVGDPVCWNAYGTLETLTVPLIECLQQGEPQSILEQSRYNC